MSVPIVLRMWASGFTPPNIATGKVAHFVIQGWSSPSTLTPISFGQVSASFEMTALPP